jgi:hypothetical protein
LKPVVDVFVVEEHFAVLCCFISTGFAIDDVADVGAIPWAILL